MLQPAVSNARLGMVIFLAAEVMFFSGLIGAFLVFRLGSPLWPPPGLPGLPLGVTAVNTGILLSSGYTMHRGLRAMRAGSARGLNRMLLWTGGLGGAFLLVQGSEWSRLIHHGLTVRKGPYGGMFYTLIGFHGIHVLGAVVWLLFVLRSGLRGRFSPTRHAGAELCGMYWYFVCVLWVVLFALVYS